MKLISHRGNIDGKKPELENHPDYIRNALLKYDCEIDVHYIDNEWYLGHDNPQYRVDVEFLKQKKLWIHAKDIKTLNELLKLKVNCFYHDKDLCTLTSKNYIWTYIGQELTKNSICVLPEQTNNYEEYDCAGICSDFIKLF